jgi:hypothetical protein
VAEHLIEQGAADQKGRGADQNGKQRNQAGQPQKEAERRGQQWDNDLKNREMSSHSTILSW